MPRSEDDLSELEYTVLYKNIKIPSTETLKLWSQHKNKDVRLKTRNDSPIKLPSSSSKLATAIILSITNILPFNGFLKWHL